MFEHKRYLQTFKFCYSLNFAKLDLNLFARYIFLHFQTSQIVMLLQLVKHITQNLQ